MTSSAVTPAPAVESINRSLSEISAFSSSSSDYAWDPPRRFSGYAKRLHLIVNQCVRSSPETTPPSVNTAFKGIAGELTQALETLSLYKNRSKIYVLIHCQTLCASLHERTVAIGAWLALLDSALLSNPDLHKKTADLSRDMQQAQFKVTENEERVYCTLQKEAQIRQSSKAVQSAIIMDLARALGMDSEKHAELAEQIRLLKLDLAGSNPVSDRRILISLERIFESWLVEPDISSRVIDLDLEDESLIPPFKNFICPLTKEVMKDPVVLESSQTYERTAIKYWFDRCIEDGRDPTCPVTGQVLKTLEQKPNINLAGAIEEWLNRNIEIQIKAAVQHLGSEDPSSLVESVERVLENVYKISEEHPSSRYRIRNAGIVVLIVKLLRNCSKSIGSHVRSKALLVLLSMAKDEESKQIMLEEGVTRLAIHSLTASLEKEREYAVKLLLEFSCDEGYCTKIASQKGALVLLTSMTGNLEHPALSNLAEEVLRKVEKVEENVQHLAAAGRFQPLLTRLCEGTEDVKIEMATLVGNMTLTNDGKEHIAQHGIKVLVGMLSSKLEGRTSSLRALHNLSSLDDNATILVDSGVLVQLTNILFEDGQDDLSELKELAASTTANIVSKAGHWELASVDKRGRSMQSELTIHSLLGLLSHASPKCQVALLQILCGIVSSPQASESAAAHIKSGNGIATIVSFLEHPEVDHRIYAFRLTSLLSERLGPDLADELRASNKLPLLKEKLLDIQCKSGERSEAACILANLPISDNEVKTVLGTSLVQWAITTLKEQPGSTAGRNTRPTPSMVEGLLGLLLHFARNPDPTVLAILKEHHLMAVFLNQLRFASKSTVKQRAALGLKHLSESAGALVTARDPKPQLPHGFCIPLMFMCGKAPMVPETCPIHAVICDEDNSFCLLKGKAIKPLSNLLNDENTDVQIAAVEALSTLIVDTHNLKRVVDELDQLGIVDNLTTLFTEVRPGMLQERSIWMVERFLRVETHAQLYSVDQGLVRALVEAFKHGNGNTKRHAQDALTNLKQLSGVSGKTSSQTGGRRLMNDR
ncbi:U-box domain-containing protein 44-like [Magnolia sinica]|uniref:U-box domain-containing protein 44-like n=1 Tax=Magnolia sinica TaxID=86752 RepID=UPI002658C051|nr:U-box domain-containing protein 44-like [Magnolia sinica]